MKFKPEFNEPVKNNYLTSDYGERTLNGVRGFHDGIDLVNNKFNNK